MGQRYLSKRVEPGDPTCGTCRFRWLTGTHMWECRRHVPQPTGARERGRWPWVADDDWCGDFEAMNAPGPGEEGGNGS